MKVDLVTPKDSNFEATGKDLKDIMFKILENQTLLRLIKYMTPDALSPSRPDVTAEEKKALTTTNVRIVPKLPELTEAGSYIIIMLDHFKPNKTNPEFRDNLIIFDVICSMDSWVMEDYMLRPYKMMHEIDKMFNKTKLNGIGRIEFVDADSLVLTQDLAGYTIQYRVINDV